MGPLTGIKVLDLGNTGTFPFCGMLLADMGADVISVEKKSAPSDQPRPRKITTRGRSSIALNLKNAEGLDTLLRMVEQVDVVTEGFRPGVVEKLGFGPDKCLAINPRLVYGRFSLWGQNGPLSQPTSQDISYSALSGVLHTSDPKENVAAYPSILPGDLGGAGVLLSFGIVCALLETQRSGHGQVVDAAIVDWASLLTGISHDANQQMTPDPNDYTFPPGPVPALSIHEEANQASQKSYNSFINVNGMIQPAPAPRFSRTRPEVLWGSERAGEETEAVLMEFGFKTEDIARLRESGALT